MSDIPNMEDAVALHRVGRLDEAEAMYRRILETKPGDADALHLLGVVAYQRNRYDEKTEDLINRAIVFANSTPTIATTSAMSTWPRAAWMKPKPVIARL